MGDGLTYMTGPLLEDTEIKRIRASGGHLPMLACRGVDFSYGQLQVLFDVDFTVDDGEMVALLGVNGAGKSTLLKVISGIGLPSAGSVRFRGEDITYLDAERRLKLGITQVPGGRAVFGPMTITENLRSFGYTMRRDRRALERAIDHTFEAFPRLAQRRNSLASTLSGLDFEIVIIDDGSADETVAVARRWSEAHPVPIQILRHEKNQGIGGARKLQFRLEIFNVLNRANFAVPNRNVFAGATAADPVLPTAGQITRTSNSSRHGPPCPSSMASPTGATHARSWPTC